MPPEGSDVDSLLLEQFQLEDRINYNPLPSVRWRRKRGTHFQSSNWWEEICIQDGKSDHLNSQL